MDRLGYWIYLAIGLAVRPLSLAATFRFGQFLGTIGYYIAIPYRRLALHNLKIAFGQEMSEAERRKVAREHFGSLVANLLSGLKIARLPREKILDLVSVEGSDQVKRVVDEKLPMIGIISHTGNWELISQVTPLLFPLAGTLYQRLRNPYIDAEMRAHRARLGLRLFERKDGIQAAIQMIRTPGGLGVLVDQHAGDNGVWCPLFGRLASTTPLVGTMAMRAGAVILPMTVHTVAPGRWRYVLDPFVETKGRSTEEIAAAVNRAVEVQVRRNPSDWLWGHNRWKTPNPRFLLAKYKRGVVAGDKPLQPFQILIRSSNWLGDAVMSVPAVKAIKEGRPDARVTVLTPEKLADFWKTVSSVDEIITIAPKQSVFSVARSIRERFDVAIIFPNSFRTALEAWLAGIPRRVGYPGHRRAWLLNQIFAEKKKKKKAQVTARAPEHQVHHYLRLAEFIGADISSALTPSPATASESKSAVRRFAICPGAEYGPAKRWLPERFAEVMTKVSETQKCEWVMVGIAKDSPVGEAIAAQFQGLLQNLIGKTTLAELITVLRECDLLLTNDTGTMHLAAYLGIPVVAIFGSTEPVLTGPLGDGHAVLRHHVVCSPCFLRECPLDFRCMKAVKVEEVVAAVERVSAARNKKSTLGTAS